MKKRIFDPLKPEDVIKELTNPNDKEVDDFLNKFPMRYISLENHFQKHARNC